MANTSIEVRIPKEITDYTEKIFLGLNIRQLICSAIGLIAGFVSYFVFLQFTTSDIAGYVVMLVVFPIFALGFYRKNGFTLEKYLYIRWRYSSSKKQRVYKTELNIERMKGVGKSAYVHQKKRAKKDRKTEARRIEITAKEKKRRSKATYNAIKKARKECERAKRLAQKGVKKPKITGNDTKDNPVQGDV